ncbi:hypothetical protein HID58_094931 [Brassica napus]|uniref:Uncharacterized protein n=1 Tax=Brassica napus TaxID=3708 RepID=A0ABQ7X5G8_BRANA|nr:hypothetical protein HID58_094931 [Brassica napus]
MSSNNISKPNDFDILSLLNSIASFKEITSNNLDLGSYLQDFNSLPSLKNPKLQHWTISVFPQIPEDNHFKFCKKGEGELTSISNLALGSTNSNQNMLPSLDPSSAVSDDMIRNQYVIEHVNSNLTSSSQESGASASAAWPDHLLDDSIFSDIIP